MSKRDVIHKTRGTLCIALMPEEDHVWKYVYKLFWRLDMWLSRYRSRQRQADTPIAIARTLASHEFTEAV